MTFKREKKPWTRASTANFPIGFSISGFRDSDLNNKRSLITKLLYWHRTNVTTCKPILPGFNSNSVVIFFFRLCVCVCVWHFCVFSIQADKCAKENRGLRVSCGINKTNYQMVIGAQTINTKWKINTNFRHFVHYIAVFLVEHNRGWVAICKNCVKHTSVKWGKILLPQCQSNGKTNKKMFRDKVNIAILYRIFICFHSQTGIRVGMTDVGVTIANWINTSLIWMHFPFVSQKLS